MEVELTPNADLCDETKCAEYRLELEDRVKDLQSCLTTIIISLNDILNIADEKPIRDGRAAKEIRMGLITKTLLTHIREIK